MNILANVLGFTVVIYIGIVILMITALKGYTKDFVIEILQSLEYEQNGRYKDSYIAYQMWEEKFGPDRFIKGMTLIAGLLFPAIVLVGIGVAVKEDLRH